MTAHSSAARYLPASWLCSSDYDHHDLPSQHNAGPVGQGEAGRGEGGEGAKVGLDFSTPAHLYTCTPLHLHTSTPAQCTPLQLRTSTVCTHTSVHPYTQTYEPLHTYTSVNLFMYCTPSRSKGLELV